MCLEMVDMLDSSLVLVVLELCVSVSVYVSVQVSVP